MRIDGPEYLRFSRWLIESTRESVPQLHREKVKDRDRQSALLFWLGGGCLALIGFASSQQKPEYVVLHVVSIIILGITVVTIIAFQMLRIILDRREAGQVHHCVTHLRGHLVPEDLAHPSVVDALSSKQLYDLINELAMGSIPGEVQAKMREIPLADLRASVKKSVASLWEKDLRNARRISKEVGLILQGSIGEWPGATDSKLQKMPARALREAAERARCTMVLEKAVHWTMLTAYSLFGIGFITLLTWILYMLLGAEGERH